MIGFFSQFPETAIGVTVPAPKRVIVRTYTCLLSGVMARDIGTGPTRIGLLVLSVALAIGVNVPACSGSDAGYATGMWGKWHLGSDPEQRSPVDFGFDEAVAAHRGRGAVDDAVLFP